MRKFEIFAPNVRACYQVKGNTEKDRTVLEFNEDVNLSAGDVFVVAETNLRFWVLYAYEKFAKIEVKKWTRHKHRKIDCGMHVVPLGRLPYAAIP